MMMIIIVMIIVIITVQAYKWWNAYCCVWKHLFINVDLMVSFSPMSMISIIFSVKKKKELQNRNYNAPSP